MLPLCFFYKIMWVKKNTGLFFGNNKSSKIKLRYIKHGRHSFFLEGISGWWSGISIIVLEHFHENSCTASVLSLVSISMHICPTHTWQCQTIGYMSRHTMKVMCVLLCAGINLQSWRSFWAGHSANRIPAVSRFSKWKNTGSMRNLTTRRLTMTSVHAQLTSCMLLYWIKAPCLYIPLTLWTFLIVH